MFLKEFFIARQKIKKGPFIDSSDLMNPVGCDRNQLKEILKFCGFSVLKLNNDRDLYYNVIKKISSKLSKKVKQKKLILKKEAIFLKKKIKIKNKQIQILLLQFWKNYFKEFFK